MRTHAYVVKNVQALAYTDAKYHVKWIRKRRPKPVNRQIISLISDRDRPSWSQEW